MYISTVLLRTLTSAPFELGLTGGVGIKLTFCSQPLERCPSSERYKKPKEKKKEKGPIYARKCWGLLAVGLSSTYKYKPTYSVHMAIIANCGVYIVAAVDAVSRILPRYLQSIPKLVQHHH